ncbi:AsnC family transcriptional regulator [Candidatus Woesearchaeota archaeon]|nr:AsnC family transcriptional regulator [Candidatus Woesearchaeota archaeon]
MKHFFRVEAVKERAKLDVKDSKILSVLVTDARASLASISRKVGLSRDAVAYRIKQLMNKGVIQGFSPFVNYKRLGFMRIRLYVLVSEESEERKKAFIDYLSKDKHVVRILEFNDRWDYEISIIVRNLDEFDKFKRALDGAFSGLFIEEQAFIVMDRYATTYFPTGFYVPPAPPKKEPEVDELDCKILHALSNDARKSYYSVGQQLNIDADTVRNRIKKMTDSGVIRHLAAVVNISRLNYDFYVFSVDMRYISPKEERMLKNIVVNNKSVIEITRVIGNHLLVYISAEHSSVLHKTIKEFKLRFANSIKSYMTLIAYRELYFRPVPDVVCIPR